MRALAYFKKRRRVVLKFYMGSFMIDVPIRTGLSFSTFLRTFTSKPAQILAAAKSPTTFPSWPKVDPRKFGMAVATVDGDEAAAGDCDEPFSLQSISKLFTLILALDRGGDEIWRRVGKEPSGTPFNHLAILESERGAPRNPFVNAGALTVTDHLLNRSTDVAALITAFIQFRKHRGRPNK